MKKILIIIPLLVSTVFAQNAKTDKSDMKSKSTSSDQPATSLDGRAYKVTFTMAGDEDKKMSNSSGSRKYNKEKTGHEVGSIDDDQNKLNDQAVSSLVHKHAVLRFENGTIQSAVLNKQSMSGCNYRITATGSVQLYSFTSSCTINKEEGISLEDKSRAPMHENSEIKISPENELPAGSDLVDTKTGLMNSSLVDTLSGAQNSTKPYSQKSSVAYISGVIDGDSITGTLTCWMTDGKSVKYEFTGTKASKNDLNSESLTGMR